MVARVESCQTLGLLGFDWYYPAIEHSLRIPSSQRKDLVPARASATAGDGPSHGLLGVSRDRLL